MRWQRTFPFFFLLIILLPFSLTAQQRIKVKWDSFLQEKPSDAKFIARINTSIHLRYKTKPDTGEAISVQFDIKAVVDSTKSYFDVGKYKDYKLLKHEQGHADIAVIYAFKLKIELENRKFLKHNFKDVVNGVYADFSLKMHQAQSKYDSETDHGRNIVMQEKWDDYFEETFKTQKF